MSETVTSILHEAYDEPEANLILVHGALDRGMAFRAVVQRLHNFDTTVYDRRGYGASLDLGPASAIDEHIADLIGLIDGKPTVVIGHSYGGLIAMLASAQVPELIVSLGVFEPPLPGVLLGEPPDNESPPQDAEDLVRWMYRRVVDEASFDRMSRNAQKALFAEAPALQSDMRMASEETEPFDPSIVSVPTLVGHGGASVSRHIGRAEWLAENLPQGSLMSVPDAAHGAHRTHPEQFVTFVKAAAAIRT